MTITLKAFAVQPSTARKTSEKMMQNLIGEASKKKMQIL